MGEAIREDGAIVTVFEYFRDKYKIELNWPGLPLVTLSTLDPSDKFPMEAYFCAEDQASDREIEKLFDDLSIYESESRVYFRTRLAPHEETALYLSTSNCAITEICSRYVFKYSCHGVTVEVPCRRHDSLNDQCLDSQGPQRKWVMQNRLCPVCLGTGV